MTDVSSGATHKVRQPNRKWGRNKTHEWAYLGFSERSPGRKRGRRKEQRRREADRGRDADHQKIGNAES